MRGGVIQPAACAKAVDHSRVFDAAGANYRNTLQVAHDNDNSMDMLLRCMDLEAAAKRAARRKLLGFLAARSGVPGPKGS